MQGPSTKITPLFRPWKKASMPIFFHRVRLSLKQVHSAISSGSTVTPEHALFILKPMTS